MCVQELDSRRVAWGNLSENHHFYCFPSQNESQGSSGARNKTCTLRTPRSTYMASFHFSVYGLAKSLSYVVVTDTIFWKKRREILLHVFALGKQHGASVYRDTFHKACLVNQKKKIIPICRRSSLYYSKYLSSVILTYGSFWNSSLINAQELHTCVRYTHCLLTIFINMVARDHLWLSWYFLSHTLGQWPISVCWQQFMCLVTLYFTKKYYVVCYLH